MSAGGRIIRWAAAVAVIIVTGIATVISYGHAHQLVTRYGESGRTAAALPLTVDGLIATCSLVLLDCARRGRKAPWHAWVLLGAGVVATLGANIAHGLNHGLVGGIIAGWPALVAVGSFELLIRLVRDGRVAVVVAEAADVEPPAELVLSHPGQPLAEVPDPGQLPVRTLTEAVRSARAAGLSVRAVAEEYGITRYRVGQLTGASTAASNGQGSAT